MSDLKDLSIEVWMDEEDVAKLSIGDEAKVTFDALPGIIAQAVITSFTPNLERNDLRDFKVELKLVDVPEDLRWGMTANISINK